MASSLAGIAMLVVFGGGLHDDMIHLLSFLALETSWPELSAANLFQSLAL